MDENLHYLLHQELEGLFDPPAAAGAGQGAAAPAPEPAAVASPADPAAAAGTAATAGAAAPSIEQTLAERLSDPKVLEALIRLLGLR